MSWIAVGVGVAAVGTAAGAIGTERTNRLNESLAEQARLDEKQRREKAGREFAKAVDAYNKLREKRPGLTFRDFAREQIEAFEDPQLLASFEKAAGETFNLAQSFADQATRSNVDNFDFVLDKVSGGKYDDLLFTRNELLLSDNPEEALRRSVELQSPFILPGGSVAIGPDGKPISGQRADAFTFQLAFETQDQLRQRQLSNVSSAIRDDRDAATRQQEKASAFLDTADFQGFASDLANRSLGTRLAYQELDERFQTSLISDFARAAATDQTKNPVQFDNSGNSALIESSLDLAARSIASNNQ